MSTNSLRALVIATALLSVAPAVHAQSDIELAKKLQNPVASLISVPLQSDFDFGLGRHGRDAMSYTLKVQPVIPFSLGADWNLITRTIVPFIHAEAVVKGGDGTGGIGDIVQSFFFSPKEPLGGWILGAGPVLLYPSASDDLLGSEKWGMGPTAVALRQEHGWTYGMLANHIASFAGNDKRDTVNATFLQPFLLYTTKTRTTFALNTESTYDWQHEQWTVPINVSVRQLLKLGPQRVQFELGYRYYAERPLGGPDWGIRFTITFLFPD
jgi:hypothetical protein